jgi:hypothetical protein
MLNINPVVLLIVFIKSSAMTPELMALVVNTINFCTPWTHRKPVTRRIKIQNSRYT